MADEQEESAALAKRLRRRGRPAKPADPGTRVALGLRVTAEVKAQLEALAAANNRTQSQEAERLIVLALQMQDGVDFTNALQAIEDRIVARISAEVAKLQKGNQA